MNSVALHGDGCPICQSVEKELIKLSRDINCSLQVGNERVEVGGTLSHSRQLERTVSTAGVKGTSRGEKEKKKKCQIPDLSGRRRFCPFWTRMQHLGRVAAEEVEGRVRWRLEVGTADGSPCSVSSLCAELAVSQQLGGQLRGHAGLPTNATHHVTGELQEYLSADSAYHKLTETTCVSVVVPSVHHQNGNVALTA